MTDEPKFPPEPKFRMRWTYEDKREMRIFIADEIDGTVQQQILDRHRRATTLTSVSEVQEFADRLAAEHGLRAAVFADADHCDPLGNWVTIGYANS